MSSSSAAAASNSRAPTGESSIVAVGVSGSHVLTINGYSQTKGLGTGNCIASSPFVVGGHTWRIYYYPDGDNEGSGDCISLFLRLEGGGGQTYAPDVKARFKLTLLDYDTGEPGPDFAALNKDHTISTFSCIIYINLGKGYSRFIRRKALEQRTMMSFLWRWVWWGKPQPTYLKNDSFKVRCDITVLKESRTADSALVRPGAVVPPSDIGKHLGSLLWSGVGADVEFDVAGETFAAHRCVLAARSPVFMAELFGPMKEKTANCVRIDDMDARAFKALLHFIYNDALPYIDKGEMTVMAQHLLVAADRYSLDRLKLVCEDELCRHVDTSTVATTLALADQHGCQGLKESCFRFLRSHGNMKAAMATDGFEHLTSSCPPLVKELLAKVST